MSYVEQVPKQVLIRFAESCAAAFREGKRLATVDSYLEDGMAYAYVLDPEGVVQVGESFDFEGIWTVEAQADVEILFSMALVVAAAAVEVGKAASK